MNVAKFILMESLILQFLYVWIPTFIIALVNIDIIYSFINKEYTSEILLGFLVFVVSLSSLCFQASSSAKHPYKEIYHTVGEKLLRMTILLGAGYLTLFLEKSFLFAALDSGLRLFIIIILGSIYFINATRLLTDVLIQLYVGIVQPKIFEEKAYGVDGFTKK